MKKKTLTPKVRAPNGFHFKVKPNTADCSYVRIFLYSNVEEMPIGSIDLEKAYRRRAYYTHSRLSERFRGMKLGALMYAKAIQWALEHGFSVRSSGGTSDLAQRVWKGQTIRKFFTIREKKTKWDNYIWYAYNKKSYAHSNSRTT
jgi:GNAT superfamily N-acetyltransferase